MGNSMPETNQTLVVHCRLDEILFRHRLTLAEASRQTGISRQTLSLLYHNKTTGIKYDTLLTLCNHFKIQPSDLLTVKEIDGDKIAIR